MISFKLRWLRRNQTFPTNSPNLMFMQKISMSYFETQIIIKDRFAISASHANIHFCASRANIPNLGLTYYTRVSTHDRPQLKPHLCKAIGKIWKAKQKSKTFVKTREAKQKSKTEKQNICENQRSKTEKQNRKAKHLYETFNSRPCATETTFVRTPSSCVSAGSGCFEEC